jgi:hypothetical protein
VGDQGNVVAPLDDHQPAWDQPIFANLAEAARSMQNFREADRQVRLNALAELQGREEAQELAAQAVSEQKAAEVRSFIEPQPQQPQVDPLAQERAALQAERQATAQVRHWSQAEIKLAENVQQWDRWAAQFPEMNDENAFAHMVRTNPQRAQQFAHARQQRDAAELRFRELQQVRAAGEQQIAARAAVNNQQQVTAWANQQNEIFQRELKTRHPEYSTDAGLQKLQSAAKRYMQEDMGLSQDEINRQWSGGGALRSAAAQIALADAVAWKLARESVSQKALAAHRAPVPRVQVPGVSRPRGAYNEDQMRDVERQLADAKGERALRLATKLSQMRRAAQGE